MSFKETILPDFVIADLYPDTIAAIIDKEVKDAGKATKTDLYRFLGKNQKKVSVIARYQDDPFIPEEHLQFLIKILSACKLNLGDVAILNDASGGIGINKLKKELDPGFVLLFAVEPVEIGLPISFPPLRPQNFEGCNFLTIPGIDILLQDTETAKGMKKQLWDCLKQMFAV